MEDTSTLKKTHYIDIRALLEATVHSDNLLSTSHYSTKVYRFPVPELENYVLRIDGRVRDFKSLLASHSSLTPAPALVAGMHIGQELLTLDPDGYISILLKQQGKSLRDVIRSTQKKLGNTPRAEAIAAINTMEMLLSFQTPGENLFTEILDQAYQLELLGQVPDFTQGNILIDATAKKLRLVDQMELPGPLNHAPLENEASRLRSCFNIHSEPDPDLREHYETLQHRIRTLVDAAREEVLSTYRARPELKTQAAFAHVTDTSAIALDAPVKTPQNSPVKGLVQRLDQLSQDANIPQR